MLGVLLVSSLKTHLDNIIFFVEIIIQMKKSKKQNKSKVNVLAMFIKEMNETTPVKQHSGKGVVSDSTVARIQDIYRGDKKDV